MLHLWQGFSVHPRKPTPTDSLPSSAVFVLVGLYLTFLFYPGSLMSSECEEDKNGFMTELVDHQNLFHYRLNYE